MSRDGPAGQPDGSPDRPGEGGPAREPSDHRAARPGVAETRTRQEYYDALTSGRGYEVVSFASLMAARPAIERPEWVIPLSRGEVDRCGPGVIDERAKRFSSAERRIAEHLASQGPAVVSVSEGYGIYGRTADARVNGVPVEFKSRERPDGQGGSQQRQGTGAPRGNRRPRLRPSRGPSPSRYPAIQRNAARQQAGRRADCGRQLHHRLEASRLAMSRQTFIFVSAPAQDPDLMHLIEQALGGTFRYEEGSDPYIRVGTAAVYVGGHEFDDDDITWPGGSDIPLRSMYPAMIEIRDTGGDLQRQQAVAGQVLAALKSADRWRTVYIDDMQKVLDSYHPGQ